MYSTHKIPSSAKQKLEGCEYYAIPNKVVAYWGGAGGFMGRVWVGWYGKVASLKSKGFNVKEVFHKDGDVSGTYQKLLESSASIKTLHGTYYWGHGYGPYPLAIGLVSHNTSDPLLYFKRINLNYKMALVLLHACGTDYGKPYLSSETAGHTFFGYCGTLVPVGVFGSDINPWNTTTDIDGGAQGGNETDWSDWSDWDD